MAQYEVGDVLISTKWPGHVIMVYEAGHGKPSKGMAKVIHAQLKGDFHIDPMVIQRGNSYLYMNEGLTAYRPPWKKLGDSVNAKKEKLREVAREIRDSATYGVYRALRLCVGSSSFGSSARQRLQKYKQRMTSGYQEFRKGYLDKMSWQPKFVTTVTCAEAVILCYQMTFAEPEVPFFIKLDAAHTMPTTLAEYLGKHWEIVKR